MPKKPRLAIVFDMDECTGSWAYGGILYMLFRYLRKENDDYAKHLYLKYVFDKAVRPYFIRCLQLLDHYKKQGKIQDVVCYTANTGVGYPEFIRDCYEIAAETPGLFTSVLVTHRGECNSSGHKDLALLMRKIHPSYKPPFRNVIAFDDKVKVWSNLNGSRKRVFQVTPYDGDPKLDIRALINDLSSKYRLHSNRSLQRIARDLTYYTQQPQLPMRRTLYDIISDFERVDEKTPNAQDNEFSTVAIPAIRSFVNQWYPRRRGHRHRTH